MRELSRRTQVKIGSIGQIQFDCSPGEELPPEQRQTLFSESRNDCNDGGGREDTNVEDRLLDELRPFSVRNSSHKIPANVAISDVQCVNSAQEKDQAGKHPSRFHTGLGAHKNLDRVYKARCCYLEGSFLLIHDIPRHLKH